MAENTTSRTNVSLISSTSCFDRIISINATTQLPIKLNTTTFPIGKHNLTPYYMVMTSWDFLMGLRHAHPRKLLSKMEQLFQLQISLFGLGKTSCSFTQSLHLFHKLYANKSKSRVMNLKEKLTNITCNTRSIAEYLQTIKGTVDDLALIDTHLSDDDLTIFALNGLGNGFKEIYTAIRARDTPVSFEELHDKLVEHEAFLKREESRGGSYVTINNTRTSLGNTNLDMAMDKVIMGRAKRLLQQQLEVHHTSFGNSSSSNWIVDSDASHHVTGDLTNLSHHQPYEGLDDILLGDGSGLEITHTGSSKLPAPSNSCCYPTFFFVVPTPSESFPYQGSSSTTTPPNQELLSSCSPASSSPSTMTSAPLSVCDATPRVQSFTQAISSNCNPFSKFHCPKQFLGFTTSFHVTKHPFPASLEPTNASQALQDPKWCAAMDDELATLACNRTWVLVPPPSNHNIVGCKWVFRIKRNLDGSISRYKARFVAKGFHQRPRVDYNDTFSPIVKPTTIRVVLSIALSNSWPISQLDVNNAFLHGNLTEDVYMAQPPRYVDQNNPNNVCRLQKALYGLKQAPRAWKLFSVHLEVISTSDGMFLSQHKYVRDLLAKFHLEGIKDSSTPMSSIGHLTLNDGSPPANATQFRSLVGGLQYLQLTCPDIAFVVNKLDQFMHAPTQTHWTAAKRLLYVTPPPDLRAYSEVDWAGNQDSYKSTTTFVLFLGGNPISWCSKKQKTVACSSTEAEYRAVASTAAEVT
ncbi:Retrovirus-related Pol polyprotein from transposon RE1 [Vitis vinifera]|uniref:Retrovirus-related Pol polyprotein from transposon RE1 n=1 Tax=Vitis vinifera TaxID=29760 RepID=A0A438FF78_VITVI|nr:Retrovirus-related Pol polyprotein from transposon RE1 [Vitis vinifera]